MYNVKNSHGASTKRQYEFYNHNLSSLFQYLCIKLVIKKLYEFEISTLDDFLILFIKLNTNFLLKGGKFKTSQIRNSQEGLKDEGTIKKKCIARINCIVHSFIHMTFDFAYFTAYFITFLLCVIS